MTTPSPQSMNALLGLVCGLSALLGVYSVWILGRYSRRWPKTFSANSMTMRRVDCSDFLLSLIATYEPRIKALLEPPPDEVIVAVSHLGDTRVPRGMVIARIDGQPREVMLPLAADSPVRPLFEAILEMTLDLESDSEPRAAEMEASVA